MKRENKREAELLFNIELKEGDNVVAFCTDCHAIVYKGSAATPIEHRILNERLRDHLDFFDWEHDIDVIYPRRKSDRVIDAQVFLESNARLTARLEGPHQPFRNI